MINKEIQELFLDSENSIVTPFNNIAMVFEDNSIEHSMLILRESNYTQIPVLDYEKKFVGLISLHQIYRKMGENLFTDFDNLRSLKVRDFIDTHYATINENYSLDDVFKLLIDYNFINVVSDDRLYLGMITRSSVLKKFNFLAHNNKYEFNIKKEGKWCQY